VLPFHVASEQALRIRSEFKKPAIKLVSELSTDRPDRVERLSDKLSLFRRHDWQLQESEVRVAYISPRTARNREVLAGQCPEESIARGTHPGLLMALMVAATPKQIAMVRQIANSESHILYPPSYDHSF
jgi:hypothetical protein